MAVQTSSKLTVIEDDNEVSQDEKEDSASQKLMKYIKSAAGKEPDVVIEEIRSLVDKGADYNYVDKETGESVMHRIAAYWDEEMATCLSGWITKSSRKRMNVNVLDNYGRSPLHVAARENNADMAEWLLLHNAKVEMKTLREHQTPLHYAARFDSVDTLEVLLQKKADMEARDYRNRTPLHLALNMGRIMAADYLISLPKPADVRVEDKDGNMAISSMIRAMPKLAYKALDQLYRVDVIRRKESFILSYLEPDVQQLHRGVKAPFDAAVSAGRKTILSHPVMRALATTKWHYIRAYFYIHILCYVTFLLLWSILASHPSIQEQYIYHFPVDLWRLILQIFMLGLFTMLAIEEMFSFTTLLLKHKKHVQEYYKRTKEDLSTLILQEEEKAFLKKRWKSLWTDFIPPYFKDIFNILTNVSNCLVLVVVIMHVMDVMAHTPKLASWVARIACFTTILLWFRVIKYLRAIHLFGPLIAVIINISGDIVCYFFLAAMLFVPYVICFWIMFGGEQSSSVTGSTRKDLANIYNVAIMAFRISISDNNPYHHLRDIDEGMAVLLVIPFLILMAIIGLNLFIALLSNTFQKVQDNAFEYSLLQHARVIKVYEDKLFCASINKLYHNYLRSKCNPLVRTYSLSDEDVSEPYKPKNAPMSCTKSLKLEDILLHLEEKLEKDIESLQEELSNVRELIGQDEKVLEYSQVPEAKPYSESLSVESDTSLSGKMVSKASRLRKKVPTSEDVEWQRKIDATIM